MLSRLFQRLKIIIVLCLFVSVALPTVSHAFEIKSEAHCQEMTSYDEHMTPQAGGEN